MDRITELSEETKDSILGVIAGDRIGQGWSRHVYSLRVDRTKVLKVEHSSKFFSNVMEWKTWEAVKDTPHAAWFAPCYDISEDGRSLIQARTIPLTPEQFDSEVLEVPEFLSDVFWGNFGYYNGRIVSHDYGRSNLIKLGSDAARMVSPKMYSPSNGG